MRLAVHARSGADQIDDADDRRGRALPRNTEKPCSQLARCPLNRTSPSIQRPPETGDRKRNQRRQTPAVGGAIIFQCGQERPKCDVNAYKSQATNARQKPPASPLPRIAQIPARRQGGRSCDPVQPCLMPHEPRHPGIRRRLDEEVKCVRQERQQAVDRRQNEIRSHDQPQQRIDPQPQASVLKRGHESPGFHCLNS